MDDENDQGEDHPIFVATRRLTYGSIEAANDEQTRVMEATPTSNHGRAILGGLLNAMTLIPLMIAITHVIFRDPFFSPYLPILMKMVFFSSAVHQLVFTFMSRLSYSVGQVQVAGMVFMSTMATNIAHHGSSRSVESTLATTMITLMLATSLLGVCLMVAGQLRLATLVHYLPMPLVGGFSAFVGLVCFQSAVSLIINDHVVGVRGLLGIDTDAWPLVLPSVVIGMVLILIRRQFHNTWALPVAMVVIPSIIAAGIVITGHSIQGDDSNGRISWSSTVSSKSSVVDAIGLFRLNQVYWWSAVRQIPTFSAMFFLVSFTSSLDVSALEMDTGRSLDFNHELALVGWSNLISGILGGQVGSIDRAQSMRSYHAAPHSSSRAAGIVVAICELLVVFIPHSLLTIVPKPFIGAILCFLALSLWREWIVHARRKMLPLEYGVVWLTFLATAALGLEVGLFFGVIGAAFHFLYMYSTRMIAEERHVGSAVIRNFEKRAILSSVFQEIVTLRLGGFIFFGSALQLLAQVKKAVLVPLHNDNLWTDRLESPSLRTSNGTSQRSSPTMSTVKSLLALENDEEAAWEGSRTRYVILDCFRVPGIDASGVRSCFLSLKQMLSHHGITLVFCSLTPEIEQLLRSHGILESGDDQCITHKDVDAALEWCEDRLIQHVQATTATPRRQIDHPSPLISLLASYLDLDNTDELEGIDVYFDARTYRSGDVLFRRGEAADEVYFVQTGQVSLFLPMRSSRRPDAADPLSAVSGTRHDSPELAALIEDAKGIEDFRVSCHEQRRLLKITAGGCFGELNYFLQQPRLYSAHVVSAEPALLYCLSRTSLTRMSGERPEQATMVQTVLLKSMSLSVANTLDLDRHH